MSGDFYVPVASRHLLDNKAILDVLVKGTDPLLLSGIELHSPNT
jgi:hypothetical protein